jgi:hypothetical protein
MDDLTEPAGIMEQLASRNPDLARKIKMFMMLRDAAEVLGELKPPEHETAAAYLQEIADHLMRDAGMPEDFLQAMIKSRPPATEW